MIFYLISYSLWKIINAYRIIFDVFVRNTVIIEFMVLLSFILFQGFKLRYLHLPLNKGYHRMLIRP